MPMEVFCRMTTVRRADLSCVVQAGGLSSRMGCDKARMAFCGEPLIERVLGRLAPVAGELVVTTSRPSELAYLEERAFGGLVPRVVADLEGPAGAMRGIASSLTAARLPLVAIVACDMPFVSSELIGALAGCVEAEALDVCVPREEGGLSRFAPSGAVTRVRRLPKSCSRLRPPAYSLPDQSRSGWLYG